MAPTKSLSLLVLVIAVLVAHQSQTAEAQNPLCNSQLSNLNVCAQFVVPGIPNPNPSPECCTALRSVEHDCVCNTLRVASRLPSLCNIAPLSCDA